MKLPGQNLSPSLKLTFTCLNLRCTTGVFKWFSTVVLQLYGMGHSGSLGIVLMLFAIAYKCSTYDVLVTRAQLLCNYSALQEVPGNSVFSHFWP